MGSTPNASVSHTEADSAFYDARYEAGYMDEWSPETKARVAAVIGELGLPGTGTALDFGCGNGVLTAVLRDALPGWTIIGTDLSSVAVQHAAGRVARCRFLHADDGALATLQVDFLFTHHVLEHVDDLDATLQRFASYVRRGGCMLHVLPCGNPGSFEYRVVQTRADGVDPARGGRFFYEDEAHLRRLTTDELSAVCRRHGFELVAEWYANQYAGAVQWITESPLALVRALTDASAARDEPTRRQLGRLRRFLLATTLLRFPAVWLRRKLQKGRRRLTDWAVVAALVALAPVSWPVDAYWRHRAAREWALRQHDPRGSEMFLAFRRP